MKENTPQVTDEMVKNFIAQEHAPVNIPYVIERWDTFKSSHSVSNSGRDWEIIEFEHKNCPDNPQLNYVYNGAGYVTKDNKSCIVKSLEWMITRPFLRIKAVKRKTDGITFSIGEKVEQEHLKPKIITNFQINESAIVVLFENDGTFWEYLNDLIGHAKPLFITEDKIKIFEGDGCFVLSTGNWLIAPVTKPPTFPFEGDKGQFKYFSTREAANEHITLNKPCLSVNDVKELDVGVKLICSPKLFDEGTEVIVFHPDRLKELAKQRIQGGNE